MRAFCKQAAKTKGFTSNFGAKNVDGFCGGLCSRGMLPLMGANFERLVEFLPTFQECTSLIHYNDVAWCEL